MTPSADRSAIMMGDWLLEGKPFSYVRLGDVDVALMGNLTVTATCDEEKHEHGLGVRLRKAWYTLCQHSNFCDGDMLTMSDLPPDGIIDLYKHYTKSLNPERALHSEALLIHRLSEPLIRFYSILRKLPPDQKVLVAPWKNAGAAEMLRCEHVATHLTHASSSHEMTRILHPLRDGPPWKVCLLGCGRAGKLLAGALVSQYPDRTVIDIGSAMDVLFYGQTRSGQVLQADARAYFSRLWWE